MTNLSMQAARGPLDAMVAWAQRRPAAALAAVLAFHLVVWTLLPILVCHNLQLDLAEDLALGKEWQLGYWKHPPLPWWIADLAYRLVPDERIVYLLGPLSAVAAMYVVWRFAREIVAPTTALIAVLALEGIHFFNFSVPKFAHDHTLMVLWPLTGWLFYRALAHGRPRDWALAGVTLALCFWSKYTAFTFAVTLGLFLLLDPYGRQAWRTPGPYLMALAFLVVLAPHLWWLIDSDFQPFRYVDARAHVATRWYHYVTFPLQWVGSQILALLPALALLALVSWPRKTAEPLERDDFSSNRHLALFRRWSMIFFRKPVSTPDQVRGRLFRDHALARDALARRLVTALALGPFLVTVVAALILGRLPIAMWGFPLWGLAPLAILLWIPPQPQRLAVFARAFLVVILAWPLVYASIELFEPLVRDRPKATQFPGRLLAETLTRQWHERTGTPLRYVGGAEVGTGPGEFAANNVAVYSSDRPHVIVHGNPRLSRWIDMADVERYGAVLVWQPRPGDTGLPDNIRANFPRAELQPPLVLPRRTLRPVTPETIHYAIMLPQPSAPR